MASNAQRMAGKTQGKVRKLQIKADFLAAYIMEKNYTDLGALPNYASDYATFYPYAVKYTGTVATNEFTGTGIATDLANKWAVFYKTADITAIESDLENKMNLLKEVAVDIRKITTSTATTITVDGNIKTGMTGVIVIDDIWWDLGQMQDYTFDESVNMISADNQMSGDYTVSVPGLKDSSISANGIFFPDQHTMVQLNLSTSADIAELRVVTTPYKYDKVVKMTCFIGKFSKSGATDGSAIQSWSADFSNATAPVVKFIEADNTLPDFME